MPRAQGRGLLQQCVGVQLAGPVAFEHEFQLAALTNTWKPKIAGNGHLTVSCLRDAPPSGCGWCDAGRSPGSRIDAADLAFPGR